MQQNIHLPFYVAIHCWNQTHRVFFIIMCFLSGLWSFPCIFLADSLSSTSSFPPWGVIRVTESPWGVLRALFGLILCIHSITFTPGSPQLGFYFSKHSLWHHHHLFSMVYIETHQSLPRSFFPSNILYSLACLLLLLQALVPPPPYALHVPSRLLNSTFVILSQGSSALCTSTSYPMFLLPCAALDLGRILSS